MQLRDLYDLRYKLYANSVLLADVLGNRAVVVQQEARIAVTVCGPSPIAMWKQILEALDRAAQRFTEEPFQVVPLCP